jgi:hypothetical protein
VKNILKLKCVLAAGLVLLYIADLAPASDLIEPSRTLKGPAKSTGKLIVFSEPARLDVTMDGNAIGVTPLELKTVEPGIHVIRVKDSETEIVVKPGESIKLSWFKGSFIKIPDQKIEEDTQPRQNQKAAPQKEKPEQPAEKTDLHPLYWPLNPKGHIF